MLLHSSSKFYAVLNARTIQCNRTPTRRLKQHFSPTCRRLIDLSLISNYGGKEKAGTSISRHAYTCQSVLKFFGKAEEVSLL